MVNYGFGTNSLLLNYIGDFKKTVSNNDLVINILNKGPNYTSDFFGIGNNTTFVNKGTQKIHYYRNVYNYINADVRLKHNYGIWTASAGVAGQYYNGDADDNTDRYLNAYNQQHPGENVFSPEYYIGVVATVTADTRDKGTMPHKGIYWTTSLTGAQGLNNNSNNYGQIQSEFSFYVNPDRDSILVIANRVGGGTTLGNATYFEQLKLGGNQNLRGFYNWRFTGKSMAFDNFEVRLKLVDFASYLLPGTLGVIGFNDIGRVWTPGEISGQWHDGYGGGFYFLPAQLILIQAVVGFSKEGAYPYISAGFRF
jgi:outer membrane protein assembly factor BamA